MYTIHRQVHLAAGVYYDGVHLRLEPCIELEAKSYIHFCIAYDRVMKASLYDCTTL